MTVLRIASCQFPVSADIAANLRYIKRQMSLASQRGARVAHFPEAALSGYAGTDFATFAGFGWDQLQAATADVMRQASRLGIWVITGSAHRLSGGQKPHNSLYVISDGGRITERYDKRFCSGDPDCRSGDLAHYSPGTHFSGWAIDGVRCGALICHDYRYPGAVPRAQQARYPGHVPFLSRRPGQPSTPGCHRAGHRAAVPAVQPGRDAQLPGHHHAGRHDHRGGLQPHVDQLPEFVRPGKLLASLFVRADGITTGRLRRNTPGVLISVADTSAELYDSTAAWRQRAITGTLHSGPPSIGP